MLLLVHLIHGFDSRGLIGPRKGAVYTAISDKWCDSIWDPVEYGDMSAFKTGIE